MFPVMTNLLHIDSSFRGGQSVSREIGASFAEAWKTAHPDGGYTHRDLHRTPAPALSSEYVAGVQTPAEALELARHVSKTAGPTSFPKDRIQPGVCGTLVTSNGTGYDVTVPYFCGEAVKAKS